MQSGDSIEAKLNAYWQYEGQMQNRPSNLDFIDGGSNERDAAIILVYINSIVDTALLNKKIDQQQYIQCGVTINRLSQMLEGKTTVPAMKEVLAELHPEVLLESMLNFSETDEANLARIINEVKPYTNDADGSIEFAYEQLCGDATYIDGFAKSTMPINGDAEFCCYDNYIPIYKLMEKYFPDKPIRLLRKRKEAKGKYIYIVTFKFFSTFVSAHRTNLLAVIPPAIIEDARKGKALIIYNDLLESTYFPPLADGLYKQLKAAGVVDAFLLLSSDWANRALRPGQKPERIKQFFFPCGWLKSYVFNYFEEAMAYSKKKYLADYTYDTKYAHIKNNQASLRHFICLNRVVKDHRVYIAYFLFANNLLDKVYASQKSYNDPLDFEHGHNQNMGLWEDIDRHQFEKFQESLPWVIDRDDMNKLDWNEVPITAMNNTFCWITTETSFTATLTSQSFRFTEKTYKPIAYFMPFIMIGDPYTLQNLRECGYRTFSEWWDESYDLVIDPIERMHKITEVILKLSLLSQNELTKMYEEMRPTLEHNYTTLINSTSGKKAMQAIFKSYIS